ncbi:transposase [Variovorax rhizosphaerae]|uniref:Transposase n=1 Tax=Variovorax rhizosphaerae TaxID=1836200 RepID=A0ABU8WYD0_9BURK
MQIKETPRARRVHGAQIKSEVLAECGQPGASVAAVALAHGLNANLVRKWLRGRGLQRAALQGATPVEAAQEAVARPQKAAALQFVPISMPAPDKALEMDALPLAGTVSTPPLGPAVIEVELRGGANQMTVRWPATQTTQCTQWLRELTSAMLGVQVIEP